MNVSILQEKLAKGLASVLRITPGKPSLPVLSNVLLTAKEGRLQLTATDLDLGVQVSLGAKVKKEGAISVPAKVFGELVSSFSPSTVELTAKNESLNIVSGENKARLSGIAASEYPSLGEVAIGKTISFATSKLNEEVSRVSFAASSDETRPALSGVYWKIEDGKLRLVATDGYRLSVVSFAGPKKGIEQWRKKVEGVVGDGLIVPARALKEVGKLADELEAEEIKVGLAADQNLIVFRFNDGEVTSRLVEGSFPNYSQVIPREQKSVAEIEVEPLEKAVRTAAIFARDSANIVHWKLGGSKLVVSANAPSYGESESEVDVSLKGDGGVIAFNSRYLMDLFSIFPEKKLSFVMNDSLDPGIFRPLEKTEFFHLIMPVRVQK